MGELAKFEGGGLKTPSREFYRSVFLGEGRGAADEKVNQ